MKLALIIISTVTVLLITFCIYMAVQEENACEARGGKMVGNGHYYATTVMAGKTPITTINEEVECSK